MNTLFPLTFPLFSDTTNQLQIRCKISVILNPFGCGSLPIARPIAWAIGGVLLLPAFYTIWSVKKYFGFKRAIGGDHFREVYRQMPLVSSGAFKYNTNAMYSFGFLLLWAIAFWERSTAALSVALFHHAYIWVHMYCTEAPDLVLLRKMGLCRK